MDKRNLVWIGVVCVLGVGGCGSESADEGSGAAAPSEAPSETAEPSEAAPGEAALISAPAAGPDGYQWTASTVSGFTDVQVPSGEGWTADAGQYANENLGITVMLQAQSNVPAEAREPYMDSFVQANERDAPAYAVTTRTTGSVGGSPAGRVDGQFNNGEVMVTRDTLVFVDGRVATVMVRGPEARLAEVQALADHVANSIH